MNRHLILVGLLLVASGLSWAVFKKEAVLSEGQPVYLELAPVDPRSLMQGDYMQLNYDLSQSVLNALRDEGYAGGDALSGLLVLKIDGLRVGTFARLDDGTRPLNTDEVLLKFKHKRMLQFGAGSFFFEEGTASIFDAAKYGELRIDSEGVAILVGLRDVHLHVLGAEQRLH